jgi:hypothetical protein
LIRELKSCDRVRLKLKKERFPNLDGESASKAPLGAGFVVPMVSAVLHST